MIKKDFFKITTSLILASIFLGGCGSSNKTDNIANDTQTASQSNKIDSKEHRLKTYLQTRGIEYKNSIYSNDKDKMFFIGTKDNKTYIFEFDTDSLRLLNEYSFDIKGVINLEESDDGVYKITAQKDSIADIYTFDSNQGKLTKKDQIAIKDPKEIIIETIEKTPSRVKDFVYSPQKYGAVVLTVDGYGKYHLYLYGLEKPNEPVREYEIVKSGHPITELKMIGGGKISYKIRNTTTVYDYFNKKIISQNSPDNGPKDMMISYLDKKYKANERGYGVSLIKFTEVEDDLYIATYSYYNPGDAYEETSLFKIDQSGDVKLIKTLAFMKFGPGGNTIKDIKIDRDNDLIIYTTTMSYLNIEKDRDYNDYWMEDGIKYTYNYKTAKSTKKLPLKPDLSDRVDNLIAFERSLRKNGIFAIGKNSHGDYEFYRFDAKSLELEEKFSPDTYGKRYAIGDKPPFIVPKENGVFEILTEFGRYFFNYFSGEDRYEFYNQKERVTKQETIDKIKDIIDQYQEQYHPFRYSDINIVEVYKTSSYNDSVFIVYIEDTVNSGYLLSVDTNNNSLMIIEEKGGAEEVEVLSINYPQGNTILYIKRSHGLDVYSEVIRKYYTKDEIVDQAYLSVGMGG
jgi:hypothetical protein